MKAFAHFCTITKHKKLVLKECFRVGLYKQGLLHDMSKYSWTEFRVGCRYYQGTRSPNNAEREEKGYSSAWNTTKAGTNTIMNTGLIIVWRTEPSGGNEDAGEICSRDVS